jgi:hypothetical protein
MIFREPLSLFLLHRARKVADGFKREEIRLFAGLAVARGVLSEDSVLSEASPNHNGEHGQ